MATLSFTPNLQRHVQTPVGEVNGGSVAKVLDAYFRANPAVRGYVLDDQGAVRKHVAVFVNGELITDRNGLSDPVQGHDDIFVSQALSGG